jgi:hypothetical protein
MGISTTAHTAGQADTTREAGTVRAVNIVASGEVVGTAVGGTEPDDDSLLSRARFTRRHACDESGPPVPAGARLSFQGRGRPSAMATSSSVTPSLLAHSRMS